MKDTKSFQLTKAKRESLAKKVEGFDEQQKRIKAFSETLQLESEGLLQQIAELRQTLEPDVKRLGIPASSLTPVTKVASPKPKKEATKVTPPISEPAAPAPSPQQREIDQMLSDLGGLADLLSKI